MSTAVMTTIVNDKRIEKTASYVIIGSEKSLKIQNIIV